jgi:hypothetical protein
MNTHEGVCTACGGQTQNTGSLGRAQPKRGQRRERNQQHAAHTAHATHMQRGSHTTAEHRARVRHAAAGALVAHHAVCRAAHSSAHGGDQRARQARSVRQPFAHLQPACARHGCQLATRPRAVRQRAARARVGHPAGAAGAAAAAAACPGARGAAVPARAPRLMCALDDSRVWDACPALALAQGAALRAFPMGLGSSRHRLLASSSRQPYRHALVISHVPFIPHGLQWYHRREEGGRRPWGALGRRGGTTKSRWHG